MSYSRIHSLATLPAPLVPGQIEAGAALRFSPKPPCTGHPQDFFPNEGEHAKHWDVRAVRAIASCETCKQKGPCLAYAVRNGIREGVWGGVDMQSEGSRSASAQRRARLARQRADAGLPPLNYRERMG